MREMSGILNCYAWVAARGGYLGESSGVAGFPRLKIGIIFIPSSAKALDESAVMLLQVLLCWGTRCETKQIGKINMKRGSGSGIKRREVVLTGGIVSFAGAFDLPGNAVLR